jgi:hypothetical protein
MKPMAFYSIQAHRVRHERLIDLAAAVVLSAENPKSLYQLRELPFSFFSAFSINSLVGRGLFKPVWPRNPSGVAHRVA